MLSADRGVSDLASVVNPECPSCQALMIELQKLTAQVEELERRLDQNSQNSHQYSFTGVCP
jgi:hypothetical protein